MVAHLLRNVIVVRRVDLERLTEQRVKRLLEAALGTGELGHVKCNKVHESHEVIVVRARLYNQIIIFHNFG